MVYDSAYFPPAHPFMLKRSVREGEEQDEAALTGPNDRLRQPGEPGRWRVGYEDEVGRQLAWQ